MTKEILEIIAFALLAIIWAFITTSIIINSSRILDNAIIELEYYDDSEY